MQRQAVTELKDLSENLFYWKIDIKKIFELLHDQIFLKEYTPQKLQQEGFTSLLATIDYRLQELNTSTMQGECVRFAKDADNAHRTEGAGQDGEKWMQLKVFTAFHLGQYQEAAKYAGLMADVYYFNHHYETDGKAGLYNLLAGKTYEILGDVSEACHHYNQYLDVNLGGASPAYEANVKHAVEYLMTHDRLILSIQIKNKIRWSAELQSEVDLKSLWEKVSSMPVIDFPEGYTENHLADAVANVFKDYLDNQSYADKIRILKWKQDYLRANKDSHGPSFLGSGLFAFREPPSYLPAIIEMRTINENFVHSMTSDDMKMLSEIESFLPGKAKGLPTLQEKFGELLPKVDMPKPR